MFKRNLLFISLIFLLSACGPRVDMAGIEASISADNIMEHVKRLASDEMAGRLPGTAGEDLAVVYIIEHFRNIGLDPGMPDGSFTQVVPLMGQSTNHSTANISFRAPGKANQRMTFGSGFVAWPADGQESINIRNAELIYVGYGIQAPEENWDDFKGVDVSGKILVVKNFNPIIYEDRFDSGVRLYYGRWGYKFEKAREMGALGALIIHDDATAGYGWSVVQNSWSNERFNLMVEPSYPMEMEGWLTEENSKNLFSYAGLDLMEMMEMAEREDFKPVPLKDVRMNITLNASYRMIEGTNVVAKLPGANPKLADQAIIFSAHHDHLGAGENGVFNGAWDNASGTAAVMEIARVLSEARDALGRSIYFVTVTAEEQGLLGSRYFAQNPPLHPGNMAANINLDSVNIFGRTNDIVVVGLGRSTVDEAVQWVAKEMGRKVKPDQRPEQGVYYRSDHFSFARIGVPALYPNQGTEFLDYGPEYNQQIAEWRSKVYHTVHDEIYDWWDLRGAAEDMKLIFRVTHKLSNQKERPRWTPGDEFEAARKQALHDLGN